MDYLQVSLQSLHGIDLFSLSMNSDFKFLYLLLHHVNLIIFLCHDFLVNSVLFIQRLLVLDRYLSLNLFLGSKNLMFLGQSVLIEILLKVEVLLSVILCHSLIV
jgi:hypothetical protein